MEIEEQVIEHDLKPGQLDTKRGIIWTGETWVDRKDWEGDFFIDPKNPEAKSKRPLEEIPVGTFRSQRWDGKEWISGDWVL